MIVPIDQLTLGALQERIRAALTSESAAEQSQISPLWSIGVIISVPATSVRAVLGELEAWTTGFAEHQIDADGYRARLESSLPAPVSGVISPPRSLALRSLLLPR
jgi:hypothetical protein